MHNNAHGCHFLLAEVLLVLPFCPQLNRAALLANKQGRLLPRCVSRARAAFVSNRSLRGLKTTANMSGLVEYGSDGSSDGSSDGEIVVGGRAAPKSAAAEPSAAPAKPLTVTAASSSQQSSTTEPSDTPLAAHTPAAAVVEQVAVPAALQQRFEHFAQLTMQGNDLVHALSERMIGPEAPPTPPSAASYSTALPHGAWGAPPDFRALLQQSTDEEGELVRLRSAYPAARAGLSQGTHRAASQQ
jgi:hypothetical protein